MKKMKIVLAFAVLITMATVMNAHSLSNEVQIASSTESETIEQLRNDVSAQSHLIDQQMTTIIRQKALIEAYSNYVDTLESQRAPTKHASIPTVLYAVSASAKIAQVDEKLPEISWLAKFKNVGTETLVGRVEFLIYDRNGYKIFNASQINVVLPPDKLISVTDLVLIEKINWDNRKTMKATFTPKGS